MKAKEEYIEREQEEVKEFIRVFENSLKDLNRDNLEKSSNTPKESKSNDESEPTPFIFLLHGLGGVGKHRLLENLKDKAKGSEAKLKGLLWFDFGQLEASKEPLKLMENIVDKLYEAELYKDNIPDKVSRFLHKGLDRNHPFGKKTFREVLEIYKETLQKLETTGRDIGSSVSKEQSESVAKLAELGGKFIGSFLGSGIGFLSNPVLTPITSKITADVGGEVGKNAATMANSLLELKDSLLNQHEATQDEKIKNLLLSPLHFLTPLFIEILLEASKKHPIVLIFEKYEKIQPSEKLNSALNEWFSQLLLSMKSELLVDYKTDSRKDHKIKIIISGRNRLTKQESWNNLEEKKYARELYLDCLKEEEASKLCNTLLEKQKKSDQEKNENKKIYLALAKGHPKYLELLCNQSKTDDSEINQEILDVFLTGFSDKQKEYTQIISCCRWFDHRLIEYFLDQSILDPSILKTTDPQKNEESLNIFTWLSQQYFVSLANDKYEFHPLVRQVLRRNLFQQNREDFYNIHNHLAIYFKERADKLNPDRLQFTKYSDLEWCEYIGEYLYHACFAQQADYQSSFLYHLFASIYLRKKEIIRIAFGKISEESSGEIHGELKDHPLLQSPTRAFLKTLEFVVRYKWVAFELKHDTHNGKYRAHIESVVQLAKNQLDRLEEGVGKVAVLEFIVKNFSPNDSKEEKSKWEKSLRDAIEETANLADPEFSSQLFMQSVCWQNNNDDDCSLDWCKKALKYKPDNANALFKQGNILKLQGDKYKNQKSNEKDCDKHEETLKSCETAREKYEEALKSYEKALTIQRYSHRFWEAQGQVLECLSAVLETIENSHDGDKKENRSEFLIQQLEYWQRAYNSYAEAVQFRSSDSNLSDKRDKAKKRSESALQNFINFQNESKNQNESSISKNYVQLVIDGDRARLSQDPSLTDTNEGKERRFKSAFANYTKAIRMHPEYPLAWYGRGLAHAQRAGFHENKEEQYKLAIKDYDKALGLREDLTWALYDKGIAFHEIAEEQSSKFGEEETKPEYKNALKNFDDAIQIDPDYEDAWYRRGLTLTKLGRYEEAIASFDKTIEITAPKSEFETCRVWYDRGIAYDSLGAYEEAIASFQRAIVIHEKEQDQKKQLYQLYDYLYHKGLALHHTEDYSNAIETYKDAIEIAEQEAKQQANCDEWKHKLAAVYYDLGRSYEAIKDHEQSAIDEYRKSLKEVKDFDEHDYNCFINLLLNRGNQKDGKEAIRVSEDALDCFDDLIKKKDKKTTEYIKKYYDMLKTMAKCCLSDEIDDDKVCKSIKKTKSFIESLKETPELYSKYSEAYKNEDVFRRLENKAKEKKLKW